MESSSHLAMISQVATDAHPEHAVRAAHVEGADDRSDAAAAFIEPLGMEIHGAADEATIAAIRSGLPSDVPVLTGADHISGFLRLSR